MSRIQWYGFQLKFRVSNFLENRFQSPNRVLILQFVFNFILRAGRHRINLIFFGNGKRRLTLGVCLTKIHSLVNVSWDYEGNQILLNFLCFYTIRGNNDGKHSYFNFKKKLFILIFSKSVKKSAVLQSLSFFLKTSTFQICIFVDIVFCNDLYFSFG